MSVEKLLEKIRSTPEEVQFADVIAVINKHFNYTPVPFRNNGLLNAAGTNEGSCKIFAFAKMHHLSEEETLVCFGQFYRDVLATPKGTDHSNIRKFMKKGWKGVLYYSLPLTPLVEVVSP